MQALAAVIAASDTADVAVASAASLPVAAADIGVTEGLDEGLVAEVARLRNALVASKLECERIAAEVSTTKDKARETKENLAETEAAVAAEVGRDRARIRDAEARAAKLEADLEAAQRAASSAPTAGKGGGGDAQAARKLEKAHKELKEEKLRGKDLELRVKELGALPKAPVVDKKALKEAEKEKEKWEKEKKRLESALKKATGGTEQLEAELKTANDEVSRLKSKLAELSKLAAEVEALKARSREADGLEKRNKELAKEADVSDGKYKEEMALRKKYWNMMEDMKGKIRVYARCRPMAKYEREKGCKQSVHFDDETTMTIDGQHGPKEFIFDAVFPPETTGDAGQAAVFADTANLIQSCMDGFNVCIFAYGQTGSGKTFTMTGVRGDKTLHGVTPRAIFQLFDEAKKMSAKADVAVTSYFLELYNDQLVDLYEKVDNKGASANPDRLEIKVDSKKMVFVKGAVLKPANSGDELMDLFEAGNSKRHVGATKMNAESSRSHSVFAVLIEVYDRTTKKTTVGKLSLVDLAGSERADKTGATADRMKEAQNINKSLSALGDVIAALSTGEKFIPYRNNKLTMLMQDSLGGNAKTLMFVNISPADYNTDETITSLTYAARVKLIKNTATKNNDSEEVAQLKAIIKSLKAGGNGEAADAA
ncbi:P-loop containing nucleoside triphosphate hydrolase protein [Pelagophyceae sp. CCMP2097]|nr:P-loop containing nucleoside triphosphate hydrolase protein [Pelagophyceae sp. CCMP2097]